MSIFYTSPCLIDDGYLVLTSEEDYGMTGLNDQPVLCLDELLEYIHSDFHDDLDRIESVSIGHKVTDKEGMALYIPFILNGYQPSSFNGINARVSPFYPEEPGCPRCEGDAWLDGDTGKLMKSIGMEPGIEYCLFLNYGSD